VQLSFEGAQTSLDSLFSVLCKMLPSNMIKGWTIYGMDYMYQVAVDYSEVTHPKSNEKQTFQTTCQGKF